MMRKMLAATLALGLMANGVSAQFPGEEARARKEAADARNQAEKLSQEAKQLSDEMKAQQRAMQRKMDALEKQLDAARKEAEGTRKRSNEAVEKARTEMRKALTERAAKGATSGKKEAYIGVVTDKVPEVLSSHLGLTGGLIVAQVLPDSPAGKGGLKTNDVLLSMNGTALESPEQFKKLVVNEKGGSNAKFLIVRGGQKTELSVTLGEREANRLGNLLEGGEFGQRFKVEGGGEGGGFRWRAEGPDGARLFEKVVPGAEWKGEGPGGDVRVFGRAKAGGGAGAAAGGGGKDGNASVNLNINNNEGKITIKGSISQDGKTTEFNESGTREELLKKIDKFPERVRDSVRQSLQGMGPGGQRGGRVRVEGRVRGGGGDGEGKGDTFTFFAPGGEAKVEMKAMHADLEKLAKDHKVHVIDGQHMKALGDLKAHVIDGEHMKALGDLKAHVIDGEHMKALKDMKIQILDAKTGALKELESLNPDQMKKLEGSLKDLKLEGLNKLEGLKDLKIDVKALHLDELKGLEHLKELEALKDLDVQVRVLAPESIKDLKDKLPKEIEVQVEKALKEAGLKDKIKDKIKDKKVIIERRDSQ